MKKTLYALFILAVLSSLVLFARPKSGREVSAAPRERYAAAEAVLESARADLEFEKASLARFRELLRQGAVSKEFLEEKERNAKTAEARARKAAEEKQLLENGPKSETLRFHEDAVRRTEASVEYYKSLLGKTLITAPISGKIIRKYLHAGESATKERALAAIADTEKTRINAEVDETDIGAIRVGDAAEVKADAFPGAVYRGHVGEISSYAGVRKARPNDQARNMDMKVVQVKILFEEKTPLKPGMTVDVKIMPRGGHLQ